MCGAGEGVDSAREAVCSYVKQLLRRGGVDDRDYLGHTVCVESALTRVLAHHGFVRRAIDAVDLIGSHVAMNPPDLRAEVL